jgi:hypothetical protein
VEDYNLLAELNTLAASRYASMTERTTAYLKFIQRVQSIRTLFATASAFFKKIIFFLIVYIFSFQFIWYSGLLKKQILLCFSSVKHMHLVIASPDLLCVFNGTETELQPHLNQIDVLHQKTTELQQLVAHLDAYTVKLEASFKKMFP